MHEVNNFKNNVTALIYTKIGSIPLNNLQNFIHNGENMD
jgi:hypothetical protein